MMRFPVLALFVVLSSTLHAGDYAIVVSEETHADPEWKAVVTALVDKHDGSVIRYDKDVTEAEEELARWHPRYTCFVARSSEADREFVATVHRLTRRYDDDLYTDTFWGILTGYDAANALEIARHTEPLTVRHVAGGTEIALDMCESGRWYDELVKNKTVVKKPDGSIVESRGPDDTTRALTKSLAEADLFVTSGHATERNWMIGFRYRNGFFRSRNGRMYGAPTDGNDFEITAENPKVYLPIGNCLMGHIDGSDAMALAWMNRCGVKQMIGYTVPTWYGYAGWGLLDYFVEQPGRYTLAEAFLANQQALMHRLHTASPTAADAVPPPRDRPVRIGKVSAEGQALGISRVDVVGLLHDRDVVAFYGDPKWEARMAVSGKIEPAYAQKLTRDGEVYTLTITPNRGADSFQPVNTNGSQRGGRPIIEFLPARITDIELLDGKQFGPVIADDFVLVPNPQTIDPDGKIVIRFRAKPVTASE